MKLSRNSDYYGAPMTMRYVVGGDVIVAVDGKPVLNVMQYQRAVNKKPGSTVRLTLVRGDRSFTVTLPVWSLPYHT